VTQSLFLFDQDLRKTGHQILVGVDEAGRGPWAGPVVAAAVALPPDAYLPSLNDSKKLSPHTREKLFAEILNQALFCRHAVISSGEIDRLNILGATHKAMSEALQWT